MRRALSLPQLSCTVKVLLPDVFSLVINKKPHQAESQKNDAYTILSIYPQVFENGSALLVGVLHVLFCPHFHPCCTASFPSYVSLAWHEGVGDYEAECSILLSFGFH